MMKRTKFPDDRSTDHYTDFSTFKEKVVEVNFRRKNPPKKRHAGRPRKEIDFDLVDRLCQIQCTGEEIAAVLGVHYDTLNARIMERYGKSFSEYYKEQRLVGSASLRRRQFQAAMDGNVTMLIWLGKQVLGQKEKAEISGDEKAPLAVQVVYQNGAPYSGGFVTTNGHANGYSHNGANGHI